MSTKQGKSQNAKAATFSGGLRSEAKKSKIVYKNVLDTPFNIPWPVVTAEESATILDALCELLQPVRIYHRQHSPSAPKKAESRKNNTSRKPNLALALPNSTAHMASTSESTSQLTDTKTSVPPILQSISIGINSVTKTLERSAQDIVKFPPPSAIFLCKGDLAPSHLYSHIGPMVAMMPTTLLFPLHKGSEQHLSNVLGMKAVGAVAILAGSKEAEGVVMMLSRMVEPMSVSWLPKVTSTASKKVAAANHGADDMISGPQSRPADVKPHADGAPLSTANQSTNSATWIPTNIKSVKTTMPIVVKAQKALKESDKKSQAQAQPLIHTGSKSEQGKRVVDKPVQRGGDKRAKVQ